MNYILRYTEEVVREDMPALDSKIKQRIKKAIEEKLLVSPEIFGKPLRRSLKGFRKLRVSDYRVVFLIEGKNITIVAIKHRSKVYKN